MRGSPLHDQMQLDPIAHWRTPSSTPMKWTDSTLGSALHSDAGELLAKVRPLGAGGVSAQWCNGLQWDVSDQLKRVERSTSRWFETVPAAKRAVEAAVREGVGCAR